uniref:Ubiquitin-like protease family profile domain-containing protein n=1 Tax=Hordeum vulgare subsp. vulgare TaxID=112509 RepID=A0A8I6Y518_HORVV
MEHRTYHPPLPPGIPLPPLNPSSSENPRPPLNPPLAENPPPPMNLPPGNLQLPENSPPGTLQEKSQAKRNMETQACSLIAYHGVIKEFIDDQRKVIADVDLDGLLRILPVTIRRNMCRSIAELYDPTCDAFIIDGEPLTMTSRDVEQILGIPARGIIWLEPGGKDVSLIYSELEAHGEHRITFAQLQKTLKAHITTNEHGIQFLRPFILYSIGVLLCPTTQRYVSSAYLSKVATIECIKATDFAKLSRDHLMKCIIKFNAARKDPERTALQGTVNLEGNLPLLQFWFWEKRRLDRLDRTIDYSKRDTPLVQYWDEQKAPKVCAIFDKHGLEAGETVHDLKEPWEVPRSPTPEMFDELPPTDSKLVLVLHDTVLRMRKELMEQHLQTRVQMLRKFRQLEKENSDMRNLLYTNLNANDYWSRPEYDYNAGDKSVPSPLRGRDLASDFDGAQDDTTSEHKEFDKEDALKSNATGSSTVTGHKKRERKSTSAKNKDFIYFVEPKRTKRGKIHPKDVSTTRMGTDDAPDEKIVEEVIDYVNASPSSKVLVQIDEIHLYRADLRCLTAPCFKSCKDGWLKCKILDAAITWVRHMRPKPDILADGKIYLERASVSGVLVRDGSVASYTRDLQNKTCASNLGKMYLSHDMVALPVNVKDTHWYVSVVNAKKRVVQVLDSKLSRTNQFKKAHPELENMDDIPRFRKQLSALLVESTFNSKGPRNNEE